MNPFVCNRNRWANYLKSRLGSVIYGQAQSLPLWRDNVSCSCQPLASLLTRITKSVTEDLAIGFVLTFDLGGLY